MSAAPETVFINEAQAYIRERMAIDVSGCWIWARAIHTDGYGKCSGRIYGYRGRRAHRLSYMAFKGPIPKLHDVDHICWNKACVNPAHLQVLPWKENRARTRKALSDVCRNGHPRTPDNVRFHATGTGYMARTCRLCTNEYRRFAYQKRKQSGVTA